MQSLTRCICTCIFSILSRIASDAVVVEDGNRTQYAPQVRILKRKSDADSAAKQGARQVNFPAGFVI